ncbi:NAD-dependent epimerase/dehydratase family protein [Mucisphaera calidilacus]|uniref:UDP-glucose 4-epimerase n=1 Tax=Mucisphaera calidilacus TaxID=2527982 RepID=A0A518BYE7_9BACT|nr:NAD-dependent epimerase/dehydratase family protein [Mucisphaera calidilacus]QDU72001.1 UDP-glucose 4-epimerase [Mucisphaera calidilacus]
MTHIIDSPIDWHALHAPKIAGRRLLVTGGAGFIGSHLIDAILAAGGAVTVLDDLSTGDPRHVRDDAEHYRFVRGTILDQTTVEEAAADCDAIVHLAALGSVPQSVAEPTRYHQVNEIGTLRVLEAARTTGVRRVLLASSAAVYGNSELLPKHEDMPTDPASPYAANKVAGESMLKAYARAYQPLDTVSLRFFNIFGPRQNANSAYAAAIAAFANRLSHGLAPTIFGDGKQSRDFCDVANVAHAILLAITRPDLLDGVSINIACAESITVQRLAEGMIQRFGRTSLQTIHEPERPGDVRHSLASIDRARGLLGYEPLVDFDTGLERTCDWYLRQAASEAAA